MAKCIFGRESPVTKFEDESLTDQSSLEMTKMSSILQRYGVTGVMDHLQDVDHAFLDVTELPDDYAAVLSYTRVAEEEFMKLSPQLRALFNNDVAQWLDAAHDEEKRNAVREKAARRLSGSVPEKSASGAGAAEGASGGSSGSEAPVAPVSEGAGGSTPLGEPGNT